MHNGRRVDSRKGRGGPPLPTFIVSQPGPCSSNVAAISQMARTARARRHIMACYNRMPIIVGLAVLLSAGSTTSMGQTSAGPQTFKYQTQIPPGIGVPDQVE